ncbi:MAG: beta-lactamase family protein [Anaerolineae bacterium]|nr:beta-lactamase family protein [Anaerolineae bacterium]
MSSEAISARIQEAMDRHRIPGLSIAVVQDGAPRLVAGFGMANVELSAPATPDTVYEIASVTKLFTATAVMRLVEEGLVALDEPIATYLPDLPSAWRPVTVRHCLAHQSGIRNYTSVPAYWDTTRLDLPRADILRLVSDLPLDFAPGARWSYDNTGYYLLGFLIERVSGLSYGAYLERHIFRPLGMEATRVNDPAALVPNRAAGYTVREGALQNAPYYSPSGTFSAGVLLSTVADMARWGRRALHRPDSLGGEPRPDVDAAPLRRRQRARAGFRHGAGLVPGRAQRADVRRAQWRHRRLFERLRALPRQPDDGGPLLQRGRDRQPARGGLQNCRALRPDARRLTSALTGLLRRGRAGSSQGRARR